MDAAEKLLDKVAKEQMRVERPSETLARQIREARKQQGLSQEALAERIKELGGKLSATAVVRLESGGRAVTVDDLVLIARALEVSPLYLLLPITSDAEVRLAPGDEPLHSGFARMWARGEASLPQVRAMLEGRDLGREHVEHKYYDWMPVNDRFLEGNVAYHECRTLLAEIQVLIMDMAVGEINAYADGSGRGTEDIIGQLKKHARRQLRRTVDAVEDLLDPQYPAAPAIAQAMRQALGQHTLFDRMLEEREGTGGER